MFAISARLRCAVQRLFKTAQNKGLIKNSELHVIINIKFNCKSFFIPYNYLYE
jgi:hypothetical protein